MVTIDLNRFKATFFEEAAEHVAAMEAALLQLEVAPTRLDLLHEIFRGAHSIKGAGGSFGFTDLTRFTHSLEGLLDRMRNGEIGATTPLVDLLLRCNDNLKDLVAAARTDAPAPAGTGVLLEQLDAALKRTGGAAAIETTTPGTAPSSGPERQYHVRFVPAESLLEQGMDPLLLLRDLAALGAVRGTRCDLARLPALAALNPEQLYLSWDLDLTTSASQEMIREVFAFVEDSCTIEIQVSDASGGVSDAALPSSAHRADAPRNSASDTSSIRVATDKVDTLINLVGEIVIAQSMITQAVSNFSAERLPLLTQAVTEMQRNTRDLQERVMSIRMVPVGTVFSRFPRLVRDLSSALGKSVRVEMSGEEIELDKGVVDRIGDPLTHMIRNSVDHGIEGPEQRRAAGKSECGTIQLRAYHAAGSVVIEIADDGRGLSTAKIKDKAVERGLIRADEALSDEQIQMLIFAPGFSTAETITDVSGRGVGMDVVRRNVEALSGSISIQSTAGIGSVFRIRLPLTLAIIDGLAIAAGTESYIIPLSVIVESIRPLAADIKTVFGQGEVVVVRGCPLPLIRLHDLFQIPGAITDPTRGSVVLVEVDGRQVGLLVDDLLGQSQVVIKSLEANYRRVDGLMGATILGDGRVAFILDLSSLLRLRMESRSSTSASHDLATTAPLANH